VRRAADNQQIEIVGHWQERLADLDDFHAAVTPEPIGYGVGDPPGVAEHGFVDDECSHVFSLAPHPQTWTGP
jgi:hypothetical protein